MVEHIAIREANAVLVLAMLERLISNAVH